MYETEDFEIWNLAPESTAVSGAQNIFNILGRLKHPESVKRFTYSVNGGPEREIFFKKSKNSSERLMRPGDFNIDTVQVHELGGENVIVFRVDTGAERTYDLRFSTRPYCDGVPSFRLDMSDANYSHEVGQVVDGRWLCGTDENSEPCLEIQKEDAGLDRIILFGRHNWTAGYEINATLSVTSWTHITHNVGLLFKWNSHRQGDGSSLPPEWSTGLGYYYSLSRGLRIRLGRDVHFDHNGNKRGDIVLKESPLSHYHYLKGRMLKAYRGVSRIMRKNGNGTKNPFSQIIPGKRYCFNMVVDPEVYQLTVWEEGKKKPSPQLVANNPEDILPNGSVGIIAYNCGVRIYSYEVSPV